MGLSAGRVWKPIGGAAASAPRFSCSARKPAQPCSFEGEGSGYHRPRFIQLISGMIGTPQAIPTTR